MGFLTTQEFTLPHPEGSGRDGELIGGDIRFIDNGKRKPLIIISHGYKTFKDWGFFPHAGVYFAGKDFVTIVMNYARNGVKARERDFTDLEAFARFTPTSALGDLHLLLDAVNEGALECFGIDVEGTPRVLIGHSGGGGVSIVTASERDDISAVAGWSPIASFDRYTDSQKERWRRTGQLTLPADPELGTIQIGLEPLEDLEENGDRLDVLSAAERMKCPLLIIHGRGDKLVPLQEAEALITTAGGGLNKLIVFEDADHLYGVSGSYSPGSSAQIERLFTETYGYIKTVLKK